MQLFDDLGNGLPAVTQFEEACGQAIDEQWALAGPPVEHDHVARVRIPDRGKIGSPFGGAVGRDVVIEMQHPQVTVGLGSAPPTRHPATPSVGSSAETAGRDRHFVWPDAFVFRARDGDLDLDGTRQRAQARVSIRNRSLGLAQKLARDGHVNHGVRPRRRDAYRAHRLDRGRGHAREPELVRLRISSRRRSQGRASRAGERLAAGRRLKNAFEPLREFAVLLQIVREPAPAGADRGRGRPGSCTMAASLSLNVSMSLTSSIATQP